MTEPEQAGTLTYKASPPVQSVLRITPDFCIHSMHPMPSAWVRFWYWTLLGWTWETPP